MSRSTPPIIAIPPMVPEGITGTALAGAEPPRDVVVIRLHAFGDCVIALPLIAALRRRLPGALITFVTAAEHADLFRAVATIDRVVPVTTTGSKLRRAASAAKAGFGIGEADLVLDIQRSRASLIARRYIRSRAWCEFDRFAPRAALDRYLDAARWAGLAGLEPEYRVAIRPDAGARADVLLEPHADGRPLVCLNPAGCWETKNWPVEEYIALGRLMIRRWNARIVLAGTGNVRAAGARLAEAFGADAVNLIGRTTPAEALAVVSRLHLMVSDDSGLMHLGWTSGVPTVALFGASRATWSRPCGGHTFTFASEDLPCGACMAPSCARGDLLCLRRVGHEEVLAVAERLASPGHSSIRHS